MLEGALDVETAALGAGDQPGGGEVDRDPDQRHRQHQATLDLRRVDQPADPLEDDQGAEQKQGDPVDLSGKDLRPLGGRR